jgi:hypothetical protein
MNRKNFVKSMLALTGTAFAYGCKETLDIASLESGVPISIRDAEKWFNSIYQPDIQKSARTRRPSIERQLNWIEGTEVEKDRQDFVWVPVNYVSPEELPTLVTWKDGEDYILKLAEFLKWNVVEGFIIYNNPKGETKGFLVQTAYDPFRHKPGTAIDANEFTGMIIHSDWNEQPSRVWRFLDGKIETYYDSEVQNNARTTCETIYYTYQTVTGHSCGPNCHEVYYTLHTEILSICGGSGVGSGLGNGSQGYPYYGGSGTGTPPEGGGGGSSPTPPTNSVYYSFINYNYTNIALQIGSDYQNFKQRLETAVTTLAVTASSFGTSATYADVMLKTLGIADAVVINKLTVDTVAKRLGWVGDVAHFRFTLFAG